MKPKKTQRKGTIASKPPCPAMPPAGLKCTNPKCGMTVPDHCRHCLACETEAGFPNVRAASKDEETNALNHRLSASSYTAVNQGTAKALALLQTMVANSSSAVICRPIAKVLEILQSDNAIYQSFHQMVESVARVPENNEWDLIRTPVDSLLFPHYYKLIRFAALSLNGRGAASYGGVAMVLKDSAIDARATVFEENSVDFFRKHGVLSAEKVPVGYRATWARRGDLAAAKLVGRLKPNTTRRDLVDILLGSGADEGQFIEVHIYGDVHRQSLAKVTARKPSRQGDQILLRAIKESLGSVGIPLEVYT